MTDLQSIKREASDQWLGQVPGIVAVGTGEQTDGSPAIVVSWSHPDGPPDLPQTYRGVPVLLEELPGGLRPLNE